MLENDEREHATKRAQTKDKRPDQRYANKSKMQPNAHRQEEMSAKTEDMACLQQRKRACNLARTNKR